MRVRAVEENLDPTELQREYDDLMDAFAGKKSPEDILELAVRSLQKQAVPAGKPARGLDVSEYMKGRGDWLTADMVEEGDHITITGGGHWDPDTFDREYLVVPVKLKDKELKLRIGPRNTERIAKTHGTNTGEWVGKLIEVLAIEEYPGLKQKGMILRGIR